MWSECGSHVYTFAVIHRIRHEIRTTSAENGLTNRSHEHYWSLVIIFKTGTFCHTNKRQRTIVFLREQCIQWGATGPLNCVTQLPKHFSHYSGRVLMLKMLLTSIMSRVNRYTSSYDLIEALSSLLHGKRISIIHVSQDRWCSGTLVYSNRAPAEYKSNALLLD
jgi:hypothetical protein